MSYKFDFAFLADKWPDFVAGAWLTIQLTILSIAFGFLLGTVCAVARVYGGPLLRRLVGAYVETIRNTPLLIQIFIVYFGLSSLGLKLSAEVSAVIALTVNMGAYTTEIMRAGIQSIPRGQVGAAQALGMTYLQTMGYIVLPQAFRNMMPVLLTQTIVLFQDTSLVYVLSITDFLGAASKVAQRDGRLVEMYLFAALVYFLISFMASLLVRRLQRRIAIIR
jgi:His/Glu/Gln/Arg/opine family amino acid ABC transporter permease subunit